MVRVLNRHWPLVGVIHLAPLPGSPRWAGSLAHVADAALANAEAYATGGIDGLIIENYGDTPFAPGRVPAETVAAMTVLAGTICRRFPEIPVGINVLRNDPESALAIAVAVGAAFIRVNVLVGAMVTDQGIIEGRAWDLALQQRRLSSDVAIWADVMVKHAAPLGNQSLEDQAADAWSRAGAATLILSGAGTGKAADPQDFRRAGTAVPEAPLVIGSGLTEANLADYLAVAHGAIVASSLYGEDGKVSARRVAQLAARRDGGA